MRFIEVTDYKQKVTLINISTILSIRETEEIPKMPGITSAITCSIPSELYKFNRTNSEHTQQQRAFTTFFVRETLQDVKEQLCNLG